EIGEKREGKIGVSIGEIADFELFHLAINGAFADQHHRDHDERGAFRGNAALIIHARQLRRRVRGNDERVDDLNGQFAERNDGERAQDNKKSGTVDASAVRELQRQRIQTERQTEDEEEVKKDGMTPRDANEVNAQRKV